MTEGYIFTAGSDVQIEELSHQCVSCLGSSACWLAVLASVMVVSGLVLQP